MIYGIFLQFFPSTNPVRPTARLPEAPAFPAFSPVTLEAMSQHGVVDSFLVVALPDIYILHEVIDIDLYESMCIYSIYIYINYIVYLYGYVYICGPLPVLKGRSLQLHCSQPFMWGISLRGISSGRVKDR